MIYDYGYATKSYKKINKKTLLDYIKIINSFMNKKDGWGFFNDLPNADFNNMMLFIKSELRLEYNAGDKNFNIQNMIVDRFLLSLVEYHYPHFNLFTKTKPDKIINKIAFIIG